MLHRSTRKPHRSYVDVRRYEVDQVWLWSRACSTITFEAHKTCTSSIPLSHFFYLYSLFLTNFHPFMCVNTSLSLYLSLSFLLAFLLEKGRKRSDIAEFYCKANGFLRVKDTRLGPSLFVWIWTSPRAFPFAWECSSAWLVCYRDKKQQHMPHIAVYLMAES